MDSHKPLPVPEESELQDDLGPFGAHGLRFAALERSDPPATRKAERQRGSRYCICCCFKGSPVKEGTYAGSEAPTNSPQPTLPRVATSIKQSLSLKTTASHRKHVYKVGSHAYSDTEWHDALSKFDSPSGDHAAIMADMDQMVRELSTTGPWVPDPPLLFAGPHVQFVPSPFDVSRFAGYWEIDEERTTPPPFPIDVMLKASFLVHKVHNSIRGFMLKETDKDISMIVRPNFTPPGIAGYMEAYDKVHATETSWALRRDLKAGRSFGRMYMTNDGTLVFRVHMRPLLSHTVDVIAEDYLRLEEGGKVLIMRVCCLQVLTGKRATQYVVGRRKDTAPTSKQ